MIPMSGTMVNKIKAYSDLFRVENSLTGLIGVVIGAVVVNGIDFSLSDAMIVSFFGLSVMFFMFSWNAYNDITDIETDRLNRPDRPLPSGKISSSSAMIGLIGTMVLSIVSLSAGLWKLSSEGETDSIISSVVIWAAAILLLILYEGVSGIRGLKHSGLIGNFLHSGRNRDGCGIRGIRTWKPDRSKGTSIGWNGSIFQSRQRGN